MSLTIIQQPTGSLASANNDNFYTVSGSNVTAPNIQDYQYLADIYVNGVYTTTQTAFPDSTTNLGSFNLKNVINNYVSYDFSYNLSDDATNIFHTGSNSSANVQVKFGEQYTTQNGLFSQSLSLVSSSTVAYLNSALTFVDQNTFDMNLLLTNFFTFYNDANYFAYPEQRQFLYYYNTGVVTASIGTYDSNGNLVGSYIIQNPYSGSTGVQFIGVGYPQLAQLPTSSFLSYTGPSQIINSQVVSYTIQFVGSPLASVTYVVDSAGNFVIDGLDGSFITDTSAGGSQYLIDSNGSFFINSNGSQIYSVYSGNNASNIALFNIKDNSGRNKANSYVVHFLNELGAMESWLFNGKNIYSFSKQTSKYQKSAGVATANGMTRNLYDRATANYYTQTVNKLELNSNWLTDNQVIFLKNLFTSPVVYVEDQSGILQAATIPDGDYTLNKSVYKKCYSLKLNLELSQPDYRQTL